MNEHRAIETVIGLLERARDKIEAGERVSPDVLARAHGFISNFADKCHHAKEENALFKAMAERGVPVEGGPIGVMLLEHDEGRGYASGIGKAIPGYAAGDKAATADLTANITGYARLLLAHIQKEDMILYPLSVQVLSEADKQAQVDEFERIEREETGPGEHEKHLALIEDLRAAVG
jgi:hemerythrin-like domain-containing protein